MKIAIIATHSFPIPMLNLHTGDIVILDLARALKAQGHDVTLVAPAGTDFEKLIPMTASYGKYPPSAEECEEEVYQSNDFDQFDIIHDFSIGKTISRRLNQRGMNRTCQTIMGGPWRHDFQPHNLILFSESQKQRVLRGQTDFEKMPNHKLGGPPGNVIKDARVVYAGVSTGFYTPDHYKKEDYFLWMGRWHDVRGFKLAISIAKRCKHKIILAGEHPDNEIFESQRNSAYEAVELSRGHSNIKFVWLPKDPQHHIVKRDLYRRSKAFLYTVQFNEPFGLSQIEAMSCGTPVIAPNYGSCPELIKDNDTYRTGYIVENSVDRYIDAMDKANLMTYENSKYIRKNTTKRFDINVYAKNLLNEYKDIIQNVNW